ncbi:antibiotic biosynthesis monooxygenase [Vibrio sp. S4M6]|uniref:putative quinol monooxygenase n=1 Tax=Vibrio sinus TaxID=2946865 RepID=UPI00202A1390|nr:putative quinol monooxygenase [Vibrio sinus]MCL9781707.1 antibiotic biosynthesis monooxygenase [Vibrio sinus]
MITVIAKFHIKPEHLDDLYHEFVELTRYSRSVAGCHRYDFYQEANAPETFVLIEEWESEQIVYQHVESDVVQKVREKITLASAAEPEVTILNPVVIA